MSDAAGLRRAARAHLEAGRRDEAARLLQQVLAQDSGDAEAAWMLGRLLDDAGRTAHALPLLARAVERAPERADFLDDLGIAARRLGRADLALRCHREAARKAPLAPGPRINEAGVLAAQGRTEAALAAIDDALRRDPGLPVAHIERSRLLRQLGRVEEALAAADRVLAAAPGHAGALAQSGQALVALGRAAEGIARLERAVALRPRAAGMRLVLGRARLGVGDVAGALRDVEAVQAAGPGSPIVLGSVGSLLSDLGRSGPARRVLEAAAARFPDQPDLYERLGRVLLRDRAYARAADALERAVALAPGSAELRRLLWNALRRVGREEEGLAHLRAAAEAAPDHAQVLADLVIALRQRCEWGPLPGLTARLDAATRAALDAGQRAPEHPLDHLSRVIDGPTNLAVARSWSATLPAAPRPPRPPVEGPLRIGYLTADLRNHPMAWLLDGLYAAHDRKRVQVHLYSVQPGDGSAVRQRAIDAVDRFTDLAGQPDDRVAAAIRADAVHVLIDLVGWTEASCLGVTALRPAAIQATWLGHPGTTGAAFIDHVVLDDVVCPPDQEATFSERVWRVPCYQANAAWTPLPPPPPRCALGLPEDGVVLCSMNQPVKLEPRMWGAWMRVLDATPGAVLWLLRTREDIADRLRAAARDRGVDPARLVFAGWAARDAHVVRLQQADLVLDTRVWGGHTSTSDALRAGVPVLTCRGAHMASRVAASLLRRVGVDDALVVDDLDAYVARAVTLAADPAARAALRDRIAAGRDALFDPSALAAALEDLYDQWVRAPIS